jgi:hypothetical protein
MRGVERHTMHVKGREKRERDEVASAEPSSGHGRSVRKKKGARDPFLRSWRKSAREGGAVLSRAAGVSERRALRRSFGVGGDGQGDGGVARGCCCCSGESESKAEAGSRARCGRGYESGRE